MIQNKKMNKRIISLMRTTKTTALFTKLDEAGLLYIYIQHMEKLQFHLQVGKTLF